MLVAGVWLVLQPMPQTSWYGRLILPGLGVALIVAGIRQAIDLATQAAVNHRHHHHGESLNVEVHFDPSS